MLKGRVVDATNGKGVAKGADLLQSQVRRNEKPTSFRLFLQGDRHRRPLSARCARGAPGTVVLQRIPLEFPQPERRYIGQAEDPKFSRGGRWRRGTLEVADFKLERGRGLVLRVIDTLGQPLAEGGSISVIPIDRLMQPLAEPTPEGPYEVVGISSDQSTVIDVIDAKESLGATVEIPDAGSRSEKGPGLEVRLEPLVSITGRVLDDEGKPLGNAIVSLFRNMNYPGQSGRSFGVSIDRRNEINKDGTYVFQRRSRADIQHAGRGQRASECQQQPCNRQGRRVDAPARLSAAGVRRPRVERPRRRHAGKPLVAVMVSYQRFEQTTAFYAPRGGVWFQETDDAGRFNLTALPRGPIKLMVYRKPQEADRQIQGIKHVDVRPGEGTC